jgi:TRAP-type transport system small permease protein
MPQLAVALDRMIRLAAVALLFALLICVVTGVVSRLLNRPVVWSDEAAQYLLVWTGFTGWMIASRRRSHIRINVFIDMLPRSLRLIMEVLIQIAVIVLAIQMIRWGWPLIGRNWDIEWVTLPLSTSLLYLPVPFAAAVLIGQALVEIGLAVQGRLAQEPEPGAQPL